MVFGCYFNILLSYINRSSLARQMNSFSSYPSQTSIGYMPYIPFNIPFPNLNYQQQIYPQQAYQQSYQQPTQQQSCQTTTPKPSKQTSSKVTQKQKISGKSPIDNSYLSLNLTQATNKAKRDPNLERLTGGNHWYIANEAFSTDIPFAKKGTSNILDQVASIVYKKTGHKLRITSALGTGQRGNPHVKGGYKSHHNAANPKIDISTRGIGSTKLASILRGTGYFSHILNEGDHLDVQIDLSKFNSFHAVA